MEFTSLKYQNSVSMPSDRANQSAFAPGFYRTVYMILNSKAHSGFSSNQKCMFYLLYIVLLKNHISFLQIKYDIGKKHWMNH